MLIAQVVGTSGAALKAAVSRLTPRRPRPARRPLAVEQAPEVQASQWWSTVMSFFTVVGGVTFARALTPPARARSRLAVVRWSRR
jgi:hypothetical protein